MVLPLLVILLITLLIFSYRLFNKDIATPAMLFTLGMCACSVNLLNFINIWDVRIHQNTLALVLGGCFFLTLGSYFTYRNIRMKCRTTKTADNNPLFIINVNTLKFIALFQVVLSLIRIYFLTKYYGMGSLAENLYAHTLAIKGGNPEEAIHFSLGIGFLISMAESVGGVLAFLLPIYMRFGKKYKIQILWLVINLIIYLIASLLSSGRTAMLHTIVTLGSFYLISFVKQKRALNIKFIFKWVIVAFVFLATFQQVGFLIGRENTDQSAFDVVGVYCGAQILNLDDYINGLNTYQSKYFGETTFRGFYNVLDRDFNLLDFDVNITDYLLFNDRKGYQLGNVATAFQTYYIDFGFWGTYIICFLIGMFMQKLYMNIKISNDLDTGVFSVSTYIFIVIISSMFMSFFAESFFINLSSLINFRFWVGYVFQFFLFYQKFPWQFK